MKDLDAVRHRCEAKKDFISQECDEHVPFIDFIDRRVKDERHLIYRINQPVDVFARRTN